ncbi:S-layer homology domain-containing protein [Paenibacillus sp. NPDC058071]|uniref:S-layer homology domain-containing protein n=1 Tax=Paenibacillus sp. NPDC058071 TaxID=3346326 RepID=UPI0036DD93BD
MIQNKLVSSKKLLSVLVILSMAFTYLPGLDNKANASEPTDQEWDEVQQLLSGIKGVWTDQSYAGAVTNGMPDTALLGNGDIGVTSAGGKGFKTFYLSKGDFWTARPGVSFTGLGNVTIRPAQDDQIEDLGENFAVNAIATGSSQHEDFSPSRAVTGLWASGYEGWVSDLGMTQWIALDLGEPKPISRYIVKHDGAARPNEKSNNTKAFTLQTSDDGLNWVDIDTVTNNNADVTDRNIEAVMTRYIRLHITDPIQGSDGARARIGQFELYERPSNSNLALGAITTANNHYENFTPDRAVNGEWKSGYEGWVTSVGQPNWIAFDLGKEKTISRYIVKHDGAARPSEYANNTRDFILQISDDGSNWTDVDSVTNNAANLTDRTIAPIKTRYIRLYITEPIQGSDSPRARIGQIELYEFPTLTEEPEEEAGFFQEEQNILNAEIDTWMNLGGVDVMMKTWTAANDNLMVTELTSLGSDPAELEVITAMGANPSYPANAGVDGDAIWVTRETPSGGQWVSRAALTTRILGADNTNSEVISKERGAKTTFVLQPGQKVQVVTAVGGGGQNPVNHLEEAMGIAGGQNDVSLNILFAEHREWWKNYWLKSYIKLNDNLLEKFYYGSLYFMGSSSREGKVAPGVFGIWATTDKPKWNGDMHLNYNFTAPFYGVYSSNRAELALPMYDLLLDYVPEAKRRAQQDLRRVKPDYIDSRNLSGGIPGLLFPVGIGPFGSTTDDNYWHQVVNSLFSASQFVAYYDYTQDKDFLRDTAYDFLKDTAEFFEHYLEYEQSTGKYVIYSGHHEDTWAKNSSSDLGLLRYLLSHLITASEDLEVDADKRVTWQHILDHLADQPTSQYNGKTVYSLADPGTSNDNRDIHPGDNTVNLEFIHPGEVLGIYSDPSKLKIAMDTLDIMDSWGQENSFPKVFNQAARVGYPAQNLINRLKQQLAPKLAPNLRVIDDNHGIEKAGAIEAINNMMVQSDGGIIKVFPVWPEGKDASFKRLREKGAFLVSSELINDTVTYIEITSEAGKPVKLENPWPANDLSIVDREGNTVEYELDGKFVSFHTEAGKQYRVLPATPVDITASDIAEGITVIQAPAKGASALTLPAVPFGFTVAIESSDHPNIIGIDGKIVPPVEETTVHLVLTVTRLSDGSTANTGSIAVVVPSRTVTGGNENEGGNTGENPGGNTGGNEGGNTGGNPGGNTGGNEGGNTGENPGGNTGGNEGGNTEGNPGGNTGGNSGNNSGNNSGSNANSGNTSSTGEIPEFAQVVKSEDFAKLAKDGRVIVSVPTDTTLIIFPSNTVELLGQNKLTVKSGNVSLDIPAAAIDQLMGSLPSAERQDSTLQLTLTFLSDGEAQAMIANREKQTLGQLKLSGRAIDVHLSSVTKGGQTSSIGRLNSPLRISLKVDADLNPNLVGIYYYADNGTLEYIGGELINGELVADIRQFGKYAVLAYKKQYDDVLASHWAFDAVQLLSAKQIINGTSTTRFEPNRSISRAEFTAMLVRMLKLTSVNETSFSDVAPSDWYAPAIAAANQAGIVQGNSDSEFQPNALITREEMVTMLMRAYAIKNAVQASPSASSFNDESAVSPWAIESVRLAEQLQLLKGRYDGQLEPKGIATRAEAAIILSRIL